MSEEGTVGALRWDTLRATFVRPERSGRVLPIQGEEIAVTSAKQGGTARKAPLWVRWRFFILYIFSWR